MNSTPWTTLSSIPQIDDYTRDVSESSYTPLTSLTTQGYTTGVPESSYPVIPTNNASESSHSVILTNNASESSHSDHHTNDVLESSVTTPYQGRGPSDTTTTHNTYMAINRGWLPNSRVQTLELQGSRVLTQPYLNTTQMQKPTYHNLAIISTL